jgi:WD40-like Beta Propeller Repeat
LPPAAPAKTPQNQRWFFGSHLASKGICLILGDYSAELTFISGLVSDGRSLLGVHWVTPQGLSQSTPGPDESQLLELPLSVSPHAEKAARRISSSSPDGIWQARCSPDGRWIVFEAARYSLATNPVLYIVPTSGGPWIPITDGNSWSDKPRWSPDGRSIYFASKRTGLLNIWQIGFDPKTGHPVGRALPVTNFDSPALMPAGRNLVLFGVSVSEDRLAISMAERTGSIWKLQLEPPYALWLGSWRDSILPIHSAAFPRAAGPKCERWPAILPGSPATRFPPSPPIATTSRNQRKFR